MRFHFVDTLALNVLDETVRGSRNRRKSQVEACPKSEHGHLLLDRIAAVVEPRSAAGRTLRRCVTRQLAGGSERAVLGRRR
jgi:hypothetical protein